MPDKSRKKNQQKENNEVPDHQPEGSEDEYARRFLLGEDPNVQENLSDKPIVSKKSIPPVEGTQYSDQTHFTTRLKAIKNNQVNLKTKKKSDTSDAPVPFIEESSPGLEKVPPFSDLQGNIPTYSEVGSTSDQAGFQGPFLLNTDDEPQEISTPDSDQLRAIAIRDYFPPPSEEKTVKGSIFTRLRNWFEQKSRLQKILLISGSVLSLALIISAFLVLFHTLSGPAPSPNDIFLDPAIPHPVKIILPDGQVFDLGLGNVADGAWSPKAAEWLVGTEVPRWLAIPWNNKMEAAARAYKVNDLVQLFMSNSDVFFYRFQSIQEIGNEEMGSFHANSTDLIIVLSRQDTQTHLAIVAVP